MTTDGRLQSLFTYPIKGLSPQPLDAVRLAAGQGFPGDRLFGFAKADSGFDPDNPKPLEKTKFLVLMQHARLAGLKASFDEATGEFVARFDNGDSLRFDLTAEGGKHRVARFLAEFLGLPEDALPRFVGARPHRFTDVSVVSESMMNAVSLINLASVRDFETRIGKPVDPIRFRANIYFDDWPAWSELELVGRKIRVGEAVLSVLLRTQRCAATEVNPQTSERDVAVPALLRKTYGHFDMGVYAEVIEGGRIAPGAPISLLTDR